jgi:hypothetical protein
MATKKARKLGRAKGEPLRTARVRYVEPPHKVTGNPFVAVRVPRTLHAAFRKWCRTKKTAPAPALREYMSKVTGVAIEQGGADE